MKLFFEFVLTQVTTVTRLLNALIEVRDCLRAGYLVPGFGQMEELLRRRRRRRHLEIGV